MLAMSSCTVMWVKKRSYCCHLWYAYEWYNLLWNINAGVSSVLKTPPKTSNGASVTKKDYIDALTPIMLRETEQSCIDLIDIVMSCFGPPSQPT